jgi:hypothetical protein
VRPAGPCSILSGARASKAGAAAAGSSCPGFPWSGVATSVLECSLHRKELADVRVGAPCFSMGSGASALRKESQFNQSGLYRLRKNSLNVWHGFSRAIQSRSKGGLQRLRENSTRQESSSYWVLLGHRLRRDSILNRRFSRRHFSPCAPLPPENGVLAHPLLARVRTPKLPSQPVRFS